MNLQGIIKRNFDDHVASVTRAAETLFPDIESAALLLNQRLLNDNKIMCCGNGAGASDAQQFSASMLNRFEMERSGLPALALTTDTATITSIANDYQFPEVFSKQIRALGRPGDILLAVTTTGESANIVSAIAAAREREMSVVLLSARDGGTAASMLEGDDVEIRVPPCSTPRTREVHRLVIHCLCDLVDRQLFGHED